MSSLTKPGALPLGFEKEGERNRALYRRLFRGAKVAKREEYLAGIAVFKEGQRLLVHTAKGALKLRSGNDIDQYVSERGFRGSKLPKGHQEVKGIEVIEK